MSSSSTCKRNETALTSECNSLCHEGRPCIAFAAETECSTLDSTFGNCTKDDFCTYECFATGPDDFAANGAINFSTFTFLITFGANVEPIEEEFSWSSEQEDGTTEEANLILQYPSKSNNILQHIERLDFMESTTRVVIAGGSSLFNDRGKVVRIQLPELLFSTDPQLQAVTLANLGLEQILTSSLPSGLINMTIANCLMTSYPEDLQTMTKLENLDLSENYFGYFPAQLVLPMLQTLNLSSNSLASFEGFLPSLITLDLSNNNLTSIPSTIFTMAALQRLNLRENPITHVQLTNTQFNFLQKLDDLNLDFIGKAACNNTQTLNTSQNTIIVCVSATDTDDVEKSSSDKALIAGIMATIIVIFLILSIIFLFKCLRRRVLKSRESNNLRFELVTPKENIPYAWPSNERDSSQSETTDPPGFPYNNELEKLLLNADDVEYIRKLTSGRVSDHIHHVAFLTRFRGSRLLVCKRLQPEIVNEASEQQRFAAEIELSASLNHPRIVSLVGVLWSRVYGLEALYEYMKGGDLRSYLSKVADTKELCSWRSHRAWKLQVGFDVVEALAYAHAFSPRLVHRNLTSHSVLLSSLPECHARLDDFVLKQQNSTNTSTFKLSFRAERWLPPEVITGTAEYSPAADMYAFGVILSEIDTHSLPYENLQEVISNRQSISDVEILDLIVSGKLQPEFTLECPTGVRELAERCLSFEASKRPTALQAVIVLRTLLGEDRRTSYTI